MSRRQAAHAVRREELGLHKQALEQRLYAMSSQQAERASITRLADMKAGILCWLLGPVLEVARRSKGAAILTDGAPSPPCRSMVLIFPETS
jgi:hypothetical protein